MQSTILDTYACMTNQRRPRSEKESFVRKEGESSTKPESRVPRSAGYSISIHMGDENRIVVCSAGIARVASATRATSQRSVRVWGCAALFFSRVSADLSCVLTLAKQVDVCNRAVLCTVQYVSFFSPLLDLLSN